MRLSRPPEGVVLDFGGVTLHGEAARRELECDCGDDLARRRAAAAGIFPSA